MSNNNYRYELINKLKRLPLSFHSPCGREIALSLDEIKIRNGVFSGAKVSIEEMVVRKLFEVTILFRKDQYERAFELFDFFFERQGISKQDVERTIIKLIDEIDNLMLNNRVLYNPF